MCSRLFSISLFFFNDTATTEIYTLSLHDALPILAPAPHPVLLLELQPAEVLALAGVHQQPVEVGEVPPRGDLLGDRKSTRLNSSHANISYAVFCLKKKNHLPHRKHYIRRIEVNST